MRQSLSTRKSANLGNMWITEKQLEVLELLIATFDQCKVPYQFTGGLAGNIHGSNWPLHDIDVDMNRADMPLMSKGFASNVVRPHARFVDEEFDLYLMTLNIEGVEVDISQVEDAYIFSQGKRVPLYTDLNKSDQRILFGHPVRVLPLKELIAYKRLLGRKTDVDDLLSLTQ